MFSFKIIFTFKPINCLEFIFPCAVRSWSTLFPIVLSSCSSTIYWKKKNPLATSLRCRLCHEITCVKVCGWILCSVSLGHFPGPMRTSDCLNYICRINFLIFQIKFPCLVIPFQSCLILLSISEYDSQFNQKFCWSFEWIVLYLTYDQCGQNWWLYYTREKARSLQKQEKI